MKRIATLLIAFTAALSSWSIELTRATVYTSTVAAPLVKKMATVLAEDIERVSGKRPLTATAKKTKAITGPAVVLGVVGEDMRLFGADSTLFTDIRGGWERYKIITKGDRLLIAGSNRRGLAYGCLHVSQAIGVSPWYWWADVPTPHKDLLPYSECFTKAEPSVKYRGVFINDEDWGIKTWAARNFERELKDIGPKTYDKICELLLRLGGNMLAPAMHSCTGAFYSHPESQVAADSWGIMITTSHCEPMLINNAAHTEWNKKADGEWNWLTNSETIRGKFDKRLKETAQYDNIYTTGMRGLHDEAMKGPSDPKDRAKTLEEVFAAQREILERYKGKPADQVPQIFVPYKEALDIYDAGLNVPEDITLVWPDDNYGYMKRVPNAKERQRSGGSGVYYHLSYLGCPHDYLWVCTTPPALMYEELRKAYDAGASRYWLLNVGDIKPMEIAVSQFFAMADNIDAMTLTNSNRWQAGWLASIFGGQYKAELQAILDDYYRLAWDRKPEFMGYEWEWDSKENERLHDTDFSLEDGSWQRRMDECQNVSDRTAALMNKLPEALRPAFFEMLDYSALSSYQMNRKFLLAQLNHATGSQEAKAGSLAAIDSLQTLLKQYNSQLDGKWDQMMSVIPPALCTKYCRTPEFTDTPTDSFRLPEWQLHTVLPHSIDLGLLEPAAPFRLVEGLGTDWLALQLGQPTANTQNAASLQSEHIDIPLPYNGNADSIQICVAVVPMWPVAKDGGNSFGVSVDGAKPVVCSNVFKEWDQEWKKQVAENSKEFLVTLPLDRSRSRHTLTLVIGDPGQIVQKITYKGKE